MTTEWARWRLKSPASRLFYLFRRRQKKASMLRVIGLCEWYSPETNEFPSPHEGPVTRKMFSFDDVIMTADRYLVDSGRGCEDVIRGLRAYYKLITTVNTNLIIGDVSAWHRTAWHVNINRNLLKTICEAINLILNIYFISYLYMYKEWKIISEQL